MASSAHASSRVIVFGEFIVGVLRVSYERLIALNVYCRG